MHKPPVKQQGKSFSDQEERAELIMPSAPWQTSCQQAGSLGHCYSLKAKPDICGAHLQLLAISLACAGLARCPWWEFPYHISPSLHKGPFMERASNSTSPWLSCQLACPQAGVCPFGTSAALQGEMPELLALTGNLGLFLGWDAYPASDFEGFPLLLSLL